MARLPWAGRGGRARSLAAASAAALLIIAGTAGSASAADPPPLPDPPPALEPIDPQVVTQAVDQDWDDYRAIPGSPYVDPTIEPSIERFERRPDPDRLPGHAVRGHPAGRLDDLRQPRAARP